MTRAGWAIAAITLAAVSPDAGATPRTGRSPVAARAAQGLMLPYARFTLSNGLRVIVRTDRKAPIVTVSLHYLVGARDEPAERQGFAHLFEHLMFSGSDHAPGGFHQRLRNLGATGVNGNTGYDGTTFYETVPTGALAQVLFLEADRMCHMDRTIDQAVLDSNRGVVRNEKRQNDNQPYGLAYYKAFDRLFPAGHPYGHPVIGSLPALDAATVMDARAWHRRYYTPRNAVLTLAGDIDARTARRLVECYFGGLAGGEVIALPPVSVPRLSAPRADTVSDRVGQVSVTRYWLTPGSLDRDGPALDVAAKILGTLAGEWLDRALVRDAGLASSITTSSGASTGLGTFIISYTVRPGVDPARVERRLDAELARFRATGPSQDDIARIAMREIGMAAQRLETSDGQAASLGEGEVLAGDPNLAAKRMRAMAMLRPEDVRAVANRWLAGPAYTLTVVPGERDAREEPAPPATVGAPPPVASAPPVAIDLPPIGPTATPLFPTVHRTRLSNGIELAYARREGVALTRVVLAFAGGGSADAPGEAGAQRLMLSLLSQGTPRRDAAALTRVRERLGATLWVDATPDQSIAAMTMPSASLMPAMDLLAGMVRGPAFAAEAVARAKADRIAGLRQEMFDPQRMAQRIMAPLLYGADSAYGRIETAETIARLTPERLRAIHDAWLRPDRARMFVVSDLPLERVRAIAEHAFGGWRATGMPGQVGRLAGQQVAPRIVVLDRPGSAQSIILGATLANAEVAASPSLLLAASVGNEALGGFGGRINDELRERRGWSYGAGGGFALRCGVLSYGVSAPVQSDRTGEALTLIRQQMADYVGDHPMSTAEFDRVRDGLLAGLPLRFESGGAVIDAMRSNDLLGRPDTYQAGSADRYRTLTQRAAVDAMRRAIDPNRMIWIVVGDWQTIKDRLQGAQLPVVLASTP